MKDEQELTGEFRDDAEESALFENRQLHRRIRDLIIEKNEEITKVRDRGYIRLFLGCIAAFVFGWNFSFCHWDARHGRSVRESLKEKVGHVLREGDVKEVLWRMENDPAD